MKNNFTISQRNAIVENHLWCIKAVMKQNRALIRAAKLDADDVYQELALRLIRAVMSYEDPAQGSRMHRLRSRFRVQRPKPRSARRRGGAVWRSLLHEKEKAALTKTLAQDAPRSGLVQKAHPAEPGAHL